MEVLEKNYFILGNTYKAMEGLGKGGTGYM